LIDAQRLRAPLTTAHQPRRSDAPHDATARDRRQLHALDRCLPNYWRVRLTLPNMRPAQVKRPRDAVKRVDVTTIDERVPKEARARPGPDGTRGEGSGYKENPLVKCGDAWRLQAAVARLEDGKTCGACSNDVSRSFREETWKLFGWKNLGRLVPLRSRISNPSTSGNPSVSGLTRCSSLHLHKERNRQMGDAPSAPRRSNPGGSGPPAPQIKGSTHPRLE